MFNSLFRKTLTVYIGVVILAFATLTVFITAEMKHLLVQQQAVVLNREAKELMPYLQRANAGTPLSPAFDRLVSRDKQINHTFVNILLLQNGNDLRKIQRLTTHLIANNQIKNAGAVKRVLNGKRIRFVGPFSTSDKQTDITVGMPIVRKGAVTGALFLHTSIRGLPFAEITRYILRVALPVILLSMCALYLTTRRLSRPLLRVTQAVDAFGRGNFDERIEIRSKDEVGQLAKTFNQMAGQLAQLEQMRKDLISNVSHELRTPLTSVRGFVQGMLDGVIPVSDHPKYLAAANKELQRLTSILNSMLDLAAIESGHIQLHMQAVAWRSVVDGVRDQVKVRLDEKHIEWRESYSEQAVRVWGDPDRLEQAIFNLLDNAIRHTDSGYISIQSSQVGRELRVEVEDSGGGIPTAALPHIWERFYTVQQDRTKTSNQSTQSGLGLTITKHLVELMNGVIDVTSTVGKGTTFTIRFPLLDTTSTDFD